MDRAEALIHALVGGLRLVVETAGAAIVALGFLIAAGRFVTESLRREGGDFTAVRLVLARYLALALEFQLGADILSTAIAPSWDGIGKLATIAVVRTGLNYFLSLEMAGERSAVRAEREAVRGAPPD